MSTRSGKRTGGIGFLVDPFITENGEYTVETANALIAHYRPLKMGNSLMFMDISGNGIHASPYNPSNSFEHSKDSPYT